MVDSEKLGFSFSTKSHAAFSAKVLLASQGRYVSVHTTRHWLYQRFKQSYLCTRCRGFAVPPRA